VLARLIGSTRAAILAGLNTPCTTTELADRHGLAASSASAHLCVLRDAGLLVSTRRGRRVYYERTALGEAVTAETCGRGPSHTAAG
jgi:DNA-binding transcriptional ArsR family regulator